MHFTEKLLSQNHYLQICHNFAKYFNENCPIPHLTKKVYFYGLTFYIKKKVFIPQKDTEILVEKTLEIADKCWLKKEDLKVLDIGTGCGNIAVSLAKNKPNWNFVAIDINQEALEVAKVNTEIHQIKNVNYHIYVRLILYKISILPEYSGSEFIGSGRFLKSKSLLV